MLLSPFSPLARWTVLAQGSLLGVVDEAGGVPVRASGRVGTPAQSR